MAHREVRNLASEIRREIISELQAINDYDEYVEQIANNEVKNVFRQIADDERRHSMELLKLLLRIDPGQCRAFLGEFGRLQNERESF